MRKRRIGRLSALLAVAMLLSAIPAEKNDAAEQQEIIEQIEETETETEFPESYFLPVESNEIAGWPAGPQIEGEAAVVLDEDTGTFLYSKNMEAKEYPASITKIMTTLVAIENGELDKKMKISDWALNSLAGTGSSMIGMTVGEKITLRQALYAVMLASANECANAVAEKVGGSEEGFVELMNQKAAELGCVNTHFVNAHGLHDENHYTCAKDMALIMRAAMQNPTFAEIASAKEYIIPKTKTTVEERSFVNHQKMMLNGEFYYKGCIGGKTGFTNDALNTLVTVAQRKGRMLICVILRTNGPNKICYETADLLNYGFKNFENIYLPVPDGKVTRADALGVHYMGQSAVLDEKVYQEPMVLTDANVPISLPKQADVQEVQKSLRNGNEIRYTYQGWPVGTEILSFQPVTFEIHKWELINTDPNAVLETEVPETEKQDVVKKTVNTVQEKWNRVWSWLYAHDIAAAVVILLVILLLLPLLIVAYIRNRSSQKIRKRRQKEREERIKIEKDIDSKSALEIEAELRAELEKEREKQKKIEEELEEQKRLEQEIAETDRILEEQKNSSRQKEDQEIQEAAESTETNQEEEKS